MRPATGPLTETLKLYNEENVDDWNLSSITDFLPHDPSKLSPEWLASLGFI